MYKSGYSVLLLTIIISTVGVALAINSLVQSTQISKTSINSTDAEVDKSKASSCVDKVLTRLRAYKFYGGDETFSDGCRVYTISGVGNDTRIIQTRVNSIILETKINQINPKVVIEYQKQITLSEIDQNNPYLIDPLALRLWLKADRAEVNNEQPVFSIKNSTDDLVDFIQPQSQSNLAPKLYVNILKNRPILRFDGVNDFLVGTKTSIHTNNGLSIIVVGRTSDTSNNDQTYISKFNTVDKEWRLQNDEFNIVSDTLILNDANNNTTNFKLITALWGATSPQLSMSINNNVASTSTGASNINTSTEPIILGSNSQATTSFLNGDIAEILVYNKKLSDNELNKIKVYFNTKYNLY
jgi:hypothetical protein